MSGRKSNITLYTDQTPNGVKIPIALEELSLEYKVVTIDITTNKQKEDFFLAINPNGRIPALTDSLPSGREDRQIRIFESGSILLYLIEQYDTDHKISYPRGTAEYYEMINWLFFQNAGLGPMQGQSNHFYRYAPERFPYSIDRYLNESRRLYKVLDTHLEKANTPYLVGDRCTIADITHFGWVHWAGWAGIDLDEFPTLKRWEETMRGRPAVKKGNDVPHPSKIKDILDDKEAMDKYAAESRSWILKGMKEDEKK